MVFFSCWAMEVAVVAFAFIEISEGASGSEMKEIRRDLLSSSSSEGSSERVCSEFHLR